MEVEPTGESSDWFSSSGYERRFCPVCGSRVRSRNGAEGELALDLPQHERSR